MLFPVAWLNRRLESANVTAISGAAVGCAVTSSLSLRRSLSHLLQMELRWQDGCFIKYDFVNQELQAVASVSHRTESSLPQKNGCICICIESVRVPVFP